MIEPGTIAGVALAVIGFIAIFIALAENDIGKYVAIIVLEILLAAAFIITLILNEKEVEKKTSIMHIENKPIYEKNYVLNQKGEIVDSIYVKIHHDEK